MSTELRRTRSAASRPLPQAAPGKAAKRSAPPPDPATMAAFDTLVESIYAWFKALTETVPIQGFAALVARSRHTTTTTDLTGAEERALGALTGLAKDDDDAMWSLLRTFSGGGDKQQLTTSFNSARIRIARQAETAATSLKEQKKTEKKAAANANTKRSSDEQPAPNEGSKKAKLAANDTQPEQPLRSGEAGARDVQVRDELHDLEARMTTQDNELRRQHALERNELREELRRQHEWERNLREDLQRLSALLATIDVRVADELRALRQGQVFLAQHVTTARVATAASLQSVQTAEKREPHVWLSHFLLTPEMYNGPLVPIPQGFRGAVFLYIMDRFTNKPILHDPHGIYPYPVPAGTWVDAWCARVDGGIQRCLPVATFATNVATATGLATEGVTSAAQAAVATVETIGSWLAPTPTAQDAQQGLRIADILDACDPSRTLCGSETCINESGDEYLRGTMENVALHKARMAATVGRDVYLAHMAQLIS